MMHTIVRFKSYISEKNLYNEHIDDMHMSNNNANLKHFVYLLFFCGFNLSAQSWTPVTTLEGGRAIQRAVDPVTQLGGDRSSIRVYSGRLFAVGGERLYSSDDSGRSWRFSGKGLPAGPYEFATCGSYCFVSISDNGKKNIYRSSDKGASWTVPALTDLAGRSGSGERTVFDITGTQSVLLAIVRNDVNTRGGIVVSRSYDYGDSWQTIETVSTSETQFDDEITPRPFIQSNGTSVIWSAGSMALQGSTYNGDSPHKYLGAGGILDFSTKAVVIGRQAFFVSNSQHFRLFKQEINGAPTIGSPIIISNADEYCLGITEYDNVLLVKILRPGLVGDSTI